MFPFCDLFNITSQNGNLGNQKIIKKIINEKNGENTKLMENDIKLIKLVFKVKNE